MKKSLILLLALLMTVAPTATGCGSGQEEVPSDTVQTEPAETEEEDTAWHAFDNLPEQDWGGRTYTILARDYEANQFFSAELTGETFNDSIYERNSLVCDQYNISIEVPTCDGSWSNIDTYIGNIRSSIQAGDGAWDLVDGYAAVIGTLVMEGCYYRLNDVPYLEPSEKWWSVSAVEDLSIKGNVYLTPGDLTMSLYDNIFALFFNQEIFEEYSLEDPYTLVNEGKWTFDKYKEIAATCQVDLNGDGKFNENDKYGIILIEDLDLNNFHYAFQIPITVKDEEGYPVLNLGTEAVANLVDEMKTLASKTAGVYFAKDKADMGMEMFKAGQSAIVHALLSKTSLFRDMEDNFGILPYPKQNEAQDGYYTTFRDNAVLLGMPGDVKDVEFAGMISEALCQASYELVKPVYYESVLKTKLTRDEQSQHMIDILRDGLILDPGAVFAIQLERAGFLTRDCVYHNHNYASYYKSKQTVFETALEKFITNFTEN